MKELRPITKIERNNYGKVRLKLKEYLDSNEIPRNRLSNITGIQYSVINRYYSAGNALKRMDIEVLAKICYTLSCKLEDIVGYVPPGE